MADWKEDVARGQLAVEWARLAHLKEIHSPEYLDRLNRERTAMELNRVTWGQRLGIPTQAEQYGEQQRKTLQLKAELDAGLMETRYTAKDKANITKLRTQQRQAWGMLQNGEITPDDYDKAVKTLKSKELGIVPGVLPSLSPYPKGEGPGDMVTKYGGVTTRDDKGNWKIIFRPDQMPDYQDRQHELEATKEKAKLDAEDRRERGKFMTELVKMKVDSADGLGKRSLTTQEMKEMMDKRYPVTPMPDPAEVQHAREYVDMMITRWGSPAKMPPEVRQSMKEAGALIEASNKRAW